MSRNKQSDTKELEERIERIRLQNEKINKRYLEVEADKKQAKDHNAMVQVTVVPEDWTCHRSMTEVPKRGDNSERNAKRDDEWDGRQNDGQGNQARRAGRGGRGGGSIRGQGRSSARKLVNQERDDEWRREREQIDQDRINRQKTSNGEWKREWDSDKASTENSRSGLPQSHEPSQGTPSPQSRGSYSGRPQPEPGRSNHPSVLSPRGQHPVQGRSPPNQQFSRGNAPPQHQGRPIVKTGPYETTLPVVPAESADCLQRTGTPERPHGNEASTRILMMTPGTAGGDRGMPRIAITISNSPRQLTKPGEAGDVATVRSLTEPVSLVSNTEIHAVSPPKGGTLLRGAEPKSEESGLDSESDESWEDVTSSAENLTDPTCVGDIKLTVGAGGSAREASFVESSAGSGAAQEAVQDATQGMVQEAVQGADQGATQGMAQEAVQGADQGATQGMAQEAVQGAVQEATQGMAQEADQGADQEATQGMTQEAVQGAVQEATQGTAQEAVQGAAQETAQGTAQEAVQGAAQEAVQGTIQGAVQEVAQEAAQGTAQEAVQGAAQEAVQGAAQEAVQGMAQEDVQGTIQGAVQEGAQEAAQGVAQETARGEVEGASEARHGDEDDGSELQTSRLHASTGEHEVGAEATEEMASAELGNESDEFHLAESDVEEVEVASLPPERREEVAGDDREECSVLSRDESLLGLLEENVIKTELSVVGTGEINATDVLECVVEKDTDILVIEPADTVVGKKEDVDMAANIDQGIVLLITESNSENKAHRTDRPTNSDESEVGNVNGGVIESA